MATVEIWTNRALTDDEMKQMQTIYPDDITLDYDEFSPDEERGRSWSNYFFGENESDYEDGDPDAYEYPIEDAIKAAEKIWDLRLPAIYEIRVRGMGAGNLIWREENNASI